MKKILIALLATMSLVGCWHRKSQEELEAEQSTRDYIRFLLRSTNEYVERANNQIREVNARYRAYNEREADSSLHFEEYPEILDMQIDTLMFTGDLDKIDGSELHERWREVNERCEYIKDYCDRYVGWK